MVEEQVRAVWTWTLLEQLVQDIRYATRAMAHNRAFTALTVLSLALGIGANTAIYSFMDAVLMRSLPVRDPASLAVVNWRSRDATRDAQGNREFVMHSMSGSVNDDGAGGLRSGIFPFPAFELLQKQSDAVFSSVFAYYPNHGANLLIDGQADVGRGEYVSGDYFLAVRDDVEAVSRLPLADDRRPVGHLDRLEGPGERLQLRRRQRCEERQGPQARHLDDRQDRLVGGEQVAEDQQHRDRQQHRETDERATGAGQGDEHRRQHRAQCEPGHRRALEQSEDASERLRRGETLEEGSPGDVEHRPTSARQHEQAKRGCRGRDCTDPGEGGRPEDETCGQGQRQPAPPDECHGRHHADHAAGAERGVQVPGRTSLVTEHSDRQHHVEDVERADGH